MKKGRKLKEMLSNIVDDTFDQRRKDIPLMQSY